MRVLIAGVDGYLGWPLALTLARQGHEVGGIDACYRVSSPRRRTAWWIS